MGGKEVMDLWYGEDPSNIRYDDSLKEKALEPSNLMIGSEPENRMDERSTHFFQ